MSDRRQYEPQAGDVLSASMLRQVFDYFIGHLSFKGARIMRSGNSIAIVPEEMRKNKIYLRRFRVKTVYWNSVVCREVIGSGAGTESGEDTQIMLPWDLQRDHWLGTAYTGEPTYTQGAAVQYRTATLGATVETQRITPSYKLPGGTYKGSEIFVAQLGFIQTVIDLPHYTNTVDLMDINVTGRAWAKVPEA